MLHLTKQMDQTKNEEVTGMEIQKKKTAVRSQLTDRISPQPRHRFHFPAACRENFSAFAPWRSFATHLLPGK